MIESAMDRLDDFRDWLYRKLCGHAQAPEFRVIMNVWEGKERCNAFWECSRCGEVLSSEYSWTLPEGSKVLFPGSAHEGEMIADYLDSHARSLEERYRTDDTPQSIRTRRQGAALLQECARLIRDDAQLRQEESNE